jgi:hypothetical protein
MMFPFGLFDFYLSPPAGPTRHLVLEILGDAGDNEVLLRFVLRDRGSNQVIRRTTVPLDRIMAGTLASEHPTLVQHAMLPQADQRSGQLDQAVAQIAQAIAGYGSPQSLVGIAAKQQEILDKLLQQQDYIRKDGGIFVPSEQAVVAGVPGDEAMRVKRSGDWAFEKVEKRPTRIVDRKCVCDVIDLCMNGCKCGAIKEERTASA